MPRREELKAATMAKLDAAYVARGAACDADYAAAAAAVDAAIDAAWDAAIAAYDDELKKHKENGAMSKSEELKQTRDAEAAADAWAKENTGVRRSNARTNRRRTMNMLGLTGEEQ